MERYDPEENKWEVIGSMAVPRYYFGCCELQGVFLAFFNTYSGATCRYFHHLFHEAEMFTAE